MVGLTPEDAEAAVELLEHEQPDEAVRDRELAERDQPARARAQLVGVAVGAADRERDRRAAAVQLLGAEDVARERGARHRRAALVERVEVRAGGERGEQRGLVPGLAHLERAVQPQPLAVLVLGGDEVRLLQAADGGEDELQRGASPSRSRGSRDGSPPS